MRADVVVVGLGSMGAAAAGELAARGLRVVGVDRYTPPHDRGAHSGGSRIIRMAYMEGPAYVPLVRRAYHQWRDARAGHRRLACSPPTGGLMLGRAGLVRRRRRPGHRPGGELPHELLDPAEVRRRFPAFTPAEHEVGLYEEIAGLVRPEAAIRVLLQRAHGTARSCASGSLCTAGRPRPVR